jgi:hypothetical protein
MNDRSKSLILKQRAWMQNFILYALCVCCI